MSEARKKIKSVEEAREFAKEQDLVLISFMIGNNYGSSILGVPKGAPLYEAYFVLDSYNQNRGKDDPEMIMTNVVRLV